MIVVFNEQKLINDQKGDSKNKIKEQKNLLQTYNEKKQHLF